MATLYLAVDISAEPDPATAITNMIALATTMSEPVAGYYAGVRLVAASNTDPTALLAYYNRALLTLLASR